MPEFKLFDPYLTRHVQIADLLSHRTGLETADLLAYRGDHDRSEILRRLQYLQPVEPFRTRYVYNNLMFVTAGAVLERVTGESWQVFLRARLLEPLGMRFTFARPRELEVEGHRNVATTLQYIHLSGRDLAAKLARGMAEVHAWRRAALAELIGGQA